MWRRFLFNQLTKKLVTRVAALLAKSLSIRCLHRIAYLWEAHVDNMESQKAHYKYYTTGGKLDAANYSVARAAFLTKQAIVNPFSSSLSRY